MHAIVYNCDDEIVQVLFARGGFSSVEWKSGQVMSLLCTKRKIEPLARHLLHYCYSDVRARINQPLDNSGTVLHHLFLRSNSVAKLVHNLRVLVEVLGADPTLMNANRQTARGILEIAIADAPHMSHAVSSIYSEAIQYLKHCEANPPPRR